MKFYAALAIALSTASCSSASHAVAPAQSALAASPSPVAAATRRPQPHDWPMYQYAPDHNAVFKSTLHASWTARLGDQINGGFALVGGVLYAVSFDRHAYAFDAKTGRVIWVTPASNILMSTPVLAKGVLVVGSGNNNVMVDTGKKTTWGMPMGDDVLGIDASTGAIDWRFHTVGEDMASPGISGDHVVFANGDQHAYGLRLASGEGLWKTAIPGVSTMGSATIEDGFAYIVSSRGQDYGFLPHNTALLKVDPRSGHIQWGAPYGSGDCSPTVGRGLVFVEGTTNVYYGPSGTWGWQGENAVSALDQRTGNLKWSYLSGPGYYTGVGSSERAIAATLVGNVLYQALPVVNEFAAFDATTGKILWMAHTAGPVKMSAVVADGAVIFGDTAGVLYSLDVRDGSVIEVYAYRHPFSTSPPVVSGKTVFLANDSSIIALPLKLFLT